MMVAVIALQTACTEARFDKKQAYLKVNDCWTPAVPNNLQTLVVNPDGTGSILAQNKTNASVDCEPLR
jgi:hypothetical protein